MIKVKLNSSTGRLLDTINVDDNCSISELKINIFGSKVNIRPVRQRLTIPGGKSIVLENGKKLTDYNITSGEECYVQVRDLGPQISWRTVFIVEYLGPLLIHQLLFLTRLPTESYIQILAYICVTFHFLKREYETVFVHRFSHATMPLSNLFKNCGHYWILSGVFIGLETYSTTFTPPSVWRVVTGLLMFMAGEMGNFYTHLVLRKLRPEGSNIRAIPKGFAFNLVSCPNYSFEILAWIGFSLMTATWSSWLFTIVAAIQMYAWAVKKHKQYRSEFSTYPRSRKILIPYIL